MPLDDRSKADYQPWNHEEFCADVRVRRMTPRQRRSYVMLLHEAFFCSTRPYLPDDDAQLEMLADCENPGDWEADSKVIRAMFMVITIDGQRLLLHPRVEADWERLIEKRVELSVKNSRNALAGWEKRKAAKKCHSLATASESLPNDAKGSKGSEASEVSEAEEVNPACASETKDDGQEESMAIRDQIESICENELGVTPERAGDAVWPRMQKLVAKHNGVHALTAKFRAWAEGLSQPPSAKPVAAFLRFYDGLPVEQARTLGEAPAVDIKRVVRDIAFLSGNKVHITDREKAFLARQMTEEDYTADEVLKAFGAFYKNLDTDNPQAVRFAGRDFVQTVDQSIHAARRIKQESERTAAQFEDLKARMQADAQAEHEAEMARIAAEEAEQAALADEPL